MISYKTVTKDDVAIHFIQSTAKNSSYRYATTQASTTSAETSSVSVQTEELVLACSSTPMSSSLDFSIAQEADDEASLPEVCIFYLEIFFSIHRNVKYFLKIIILT